MTIQFPADRGEVVSRIQTEVKNSAPTANPFLRNSWIYALIVGLAGRIYEIYYQLQYNLLPEMFPDTATSTYLERWGSYVGITRNPATQATGYITAIGTVATAIPISTSWQTSDGLEVVSTAAATIATTTRSVSSLTRSGLIATVVTTVAHNFGTGQYVTIAGATPIAYNGTWQIVVSNATTFLFTPGGAPATPATGTITAAADMASIAVETEDYGQEANIVAGAQVTLSSPIAGISDTAFVQYGGLSGGADLETDDELRTRIIYRWANPVAQFNDESIINKAKEVSGVTRVWVQDATPTVGQVTIYFTRDNDASPIPDAGEITTTKAKILEIKPANTADSDVIVSAPTPITVPFTFSALSPNTTSMQTAITANLTQLFSEDTEVGENLTAYAYQSAIWNTVDTETGARVLSFTLSTPTTDVTIASGQLAILGAVTYP